MEFPSKGQISEEIPLIAMHLPHPPHVKTYHLWNSRGPCYCGCSLFQYRDAAATVA